MAFSHAYWSVVFQLLGSVCFSLTLLALPTVLDMVFSLLRPAKHSVIALLISFQSIIFLKKSHKNFPRAWFFFDLYFCNYFIVVLQCSHRMWWKYFLRGGTLLKIFWWSNITWVTVTFLIIFSERSKQKIFLFNHSFIHSALFPCVSYRSDIGWGTAGYKIRKSQAFFKVVKVWMGHRHIKTYL